MSSQKEKGISEFIVKDTLKKRKKVFLRQDHQKKKKLRKVWRYPRGIHSKLRHRLRGYGIIVKPGYKTPKIFRNKTIEGYKIMTVKNKKDLELAKELSKNEKISVRIARTLGKKKRLALLNDIKKSGLKCDFNIEKQLSKIKTEFEQKKKEKKEEKAKTKEKEEEKEKARTEAKKELKESKKEKEEIKDQKEIEREEFEKIIRSQKG
jgi:large subunit ribosomal protein L32e